MSHKDVNEMVKDMVIFNFEKTIERDIDRLICEELYSSPDFLTFILVKIGVNNGSLLSIEHSKWNTIDNRRSETDIEVRYQNDEGIHGLLIEDKVSAPPQPDQAEGYRQRGDMHVAESRYVDYKTVLVAPALYLKNKYNQCDKYDHNISHEEIAEYFDNKEDKHNSFRHSCLKHSIVKQRNSARQLFADSSIPEWYAMYVDLIEKSGYENLTLTDVYTPNGKVKPNWVHYNTPSQKFFIEHKIHQGKIELHFKGCTADDIPTIKKYVEPIADSYDCLREKYIIDREGKGDRRIIMLYDKLQGFKIVDGNTGKANLSILRDNKDYFNKVFRIINCMYEIVERIKYIEFKKHL